VTVIHDAVVATSLEMLRAERARRSLRVFVEQAWPIVEAVPFVSNWHIDSKPSFAPDPTTSPGSRCEARPVRWFRSAPCSPWTSASDRRASRASISFLPRV
jgi:hypothetical protein